MTTEMKPAVFENAAFGSVRVVMREGDPWFVAKDVCDCLGIVNSRDALSSLDADEKGVATADTLGGNQEMQTVSEAGLYLLIFRSRKPEAKDFKRWVTHEVLPSIRKTGQYSAVPTLPDFTKPAVAARAWADEFEAKIAAQEALAIEQQAHENTRQHLALTEEQRDEAIRQKSWISTHREASAMGTASAATRRANNWKASAGVLADTVETQRDTIDDLNDKLGQGETRKATKAIPWLLEIFAPSKGMYSVVGRKLTQIGRKMGIPPLEMESAEFGTLKLHHVKVIQTLYYMLLADPNMLRAYRKA